MADKSIRQKIVDAVDTRMKTILTSGGYESNAGQYVYWWRPKVEQKKLPAIVLRDRQVPPENKIRWRRHLIIGLEIFLSPSETADEEMRKVLADIEVCVGLDVTWGGLADDTELYESEKMDLDDWEVVNVASGFYLIIEYETEPWNPRA